MFASSSTTRTRGVSHVRMLASAACAYPVADLREGRNSAEVPGESQGFARLIIDPACTGTRTRSAAMIGRRVVAAGVGRGGGGGRRRGRRGDRRPRALGRVELARRRDDGLRLDDRPRRPTAADHVRGVHRRRRRACSTRRPRRSTSSTEELLAEAERRQDHDRRRRQGSRTSTRRRDRRDGRGRRQASIDDIVNNPFPKLPDFKGGDRGGMRRSRPLRWRIRRSARPAADSFDSPSRRRSASRPRS